jgi:hypothetical protein
MGFYKSTYHPQLLWLCKNLFNMKIRITENQLKKIKIIISEQEFMYHIGNLNLEKKLKPHHSESIIRMDEGRGNGHFGSGTYFSTYNCVDFDYRDYKEKYDNVEPNKRNLVQVDVRLYRVDANLYTNLYRVKNYKQGYYLHETLKFINKSIYNEPEDNKKLYPKLKNNLELLGLKMPPYREFLNMLEIAKNDRDEGFVDTSVYRPSLSTRIMEYNGYNGVNVSGIPELDNKRYGSVIYDISKVDENFHKVDENKVNDYCSFKKQTIINRNPLPKKDYELIIHILNDDDRIDIDVLKKIPENLLPFFLNRYKYFLYDDEIKDLEQTFPNFRKLYFSTLLRKLNKGIMEIHRQDIPNGIIPIIEYKFDSIFTNYHLFKLIIEEPREFNDDIIEKIIKKVEGGYYDKLSEKQKEAYDEFKEDYSYYYFVNKEVD